MNTKTVKKLGATLAVFIGAAITAPVFAWVSTGPQALGLPASAIDVWRFNCPASHPRARARVNDILPANNAAVLSVVLGRNSETAQTTDVNSSAVEHNTAFSAAATVVKGEGLYAVAFKKSATGTDGYVGQVECFRLSPAPLVFNPEFLSNQREINQ
jgi:hypothetical protein